MSIPSDFIYDLTPNEKPLYSNDFFELELLQYIKQNSDNNATDIINDSIEESSKNEQTINTSFTDNKKLDKKTNKSFRITLIKKNKSFLKSSHSFNITKIEKSE